MGIFFLDVLSPLQGGQQSWRKHPFYRILMGFCLPGNVIYFHATKMSNCPFPHIMTLKKTDFGLYQQKYGVTIM